MAKRLKLSELKPKTKLGIDKTFKICWNCMFWDSETGRCPMVKDKLSRPPTYWSNFPYNHKCEVLKLFRYRLEYVYEDYDKFSYKE